MSNITGTNIASGICPFTTMDDFATHSAIYGKGGHRTVTSIIDRNMISFKRRELLMTVSVTDTGKTYKLIRNMDVIETADTDWEVIHYDRMAFVIPTVRVGINRLEFKVSENSSLVKIEANAPSDLILTENLELNIECKRNNIWIVAGSTTILKDTNDSVTNINPGFAMTSELIRVNIVSAQSGLSNLVVIVTV